MSARRGMRPLRRRRNIKRSLLLLAVGLAILLLAFYGWATTTLRIEK